MSEGVILLVEDNENDEILTCRALKNYSILNDVIVARDGEEAMDYLLGAGKYADQPQKSMPVLVLLDIKLPKQNGIEVLRQIRSHEKTKLLPVVMMTSSNQESDVMESYKLGANSYIVKPVDYAQFNEAVKQVGLYWMLLNRKPSLR